MSQLRTKIDQLEEKQYRRLLEDLDRNLEGRSLEDVEFFCAHGYLPEVPIPGPAFVPERLSWDERWKQWKKHERRFANRSVEEREVFCAHGYWPSKIKGDTSDEP